MAAGVTVPRLWPGETFAILASGPSLCVDDVNYCTGRARIIAVKDAIRLAPHAECLYGCDASFWHRHQGFPTYLGLKYSIDPKAARWATVLRNTGEAGLETDPSGLRTGQNSTYQAINLAVHFGALRILLLGLDMGHSPHGRKYFFGDRPHDQQVTSPFAAMRLLFDTIVAPLVALGVTVINCSRQTALDCFSRQPLHEALG